MRKPPLPPPVTPAAAPTPPAPAQTAQSMFAQNPSRASGGRFLIPNSLTTPAGIQALASTQRRSLIGGPIGA